MPGEKILVIDDDANILEVLQMRLKAWNYHVTIARNGNEAKTALSTISFNLAIIDLRLSEENGIKLMEEIISNYPNLPVIILTAHGSIESAVEAMRRGAYSYITKPFNNEDLSLHIKNALEKQLLTKEIEHLRSQLDEQNNFKHIIGNNKRMQEILERVSKIAKTDCTVSIYGESGTGKELIAKAIHYNSNRSKNPFVATNCGAIPEGLLENELFGHVRGAYTDAHESKEGLFSQANEGTIFLDEIDAFTPALQVKLLRVLQDGEYERVGETKTRKADVRIIAATNQHLEELIKQGKFRNDLFYRLNIISIELPPLRDRKEDITLLVEHFIEKHSTVLNKQINGISDEAFKYLMKHDWPGNVRELENVIERACVLTNGPLIEPVDMPEHILKDKLGSCILAGQRTLDDGSNGSSLKDALKDPERKIILEAIEKCRGNKKEAAKLLGINRTTLYKKLNQFGLISNDTKV